jgi:hypothetical protein
MRVQSHNAALSTTATYLSCCPYMNVLDSHNVARLQVASDSM